MSNQPPRTPIAPPGQPRLTLSELRHLTSSELSDLHDSYIIEDRQHTPLAVLIPHSRYTEMQELLLSWDKVRREYKAMQDEVEERRKKEPVE